MYKQDLFLNIMLSIETKLYQSWWKHSVSTEVILSLLMCKGIPRRK